MEVNVAWLTRTELKEMNFCSFGENVYISNKASYYNCPQISIGNNVRIDDFCVLSAGKGGIKIGDHVHIAVYVALIGAETIFLDDFSGISSKVTIYSSNDDYSGEYLTGPTVPVAFTNVNSAAVYVGRHAVIGSGSVVLPGVTIEEGAIVGALSLVNKNCEAFGMYVGSPAKNKKTRSTQLLSVEKEFLKEKND